ncbi:MAG: CPBP family intramembrane metalloprotease [Lachnospiraceae bacterium]|nr:CPBP family intramembrane metalloprotease [Lachnospiraceae bacterium]
MKQNSFAKFWDVISPIFVYFIITTLTLIALDFLMLVLPITEESALFRQLISSLTAGAFLWTVYRQSDLGKREIKGKYLAVSVIIGGCFAVAWNNILGLTGIQNYSQSYAQVTETFYTGRLLLEFMALCIVIPIVEELLYRGIIYARIKKWLGIKAAVLLSAIIFGLVHMNLVQFVYAAVFGILLAFITEKTGNFYAAAFAHMAANFTSVLRAETSVFAFMDDSRIIMLMITAILLVFTMLGLQFVRKE